MLPYLTALKNNDETALKRVFEEYYPVLYNYIFDKTGSDDITKDIIQVTFIRLWKYRQSLNAEIELSIQIFKIARTTMIDDLRKQHYQNKIKQATNSKSHHDPHEDVFYHDTLKKLENLIKQMPPVRQEVFRLSRLNNYSHKEIADLLSISTKTVENHITLALRFIKPFFLFVIFIKILF